MEKDQSKFIENLRQVKEKTSQVVSLAQNRGLNEVIEVLKKKTAVVLTACSGLYKGTTPRSDAVHEIDEAMKGVGQAVKVLVTPNAKEMLERRRAESVARSKANQPSQASSSASNSNASARSNTSSSPSASPKPQAQPQAQPQTQPQAQPQPVQMLLPPGIVLPDIESVTMADGAIFKSGWLTKKGGGTKTLGRKSWQKRWFILTPQKLQYFANQTMKDQKGAIELSECRSCVLKNETGSRLLELETNQRKMDIEAESRQFAEEWLDAINAIGRIHSRKRAHAFTNAFC